MGSGSQGRLRQRAGAWTPDHRVLRVALFAGRRCLLTLIALLLAVRPALAAGPTYRNPLVRDVADPFVLKYRGEYYLYRTAVRGGLDVMTSRDLVHWRPGPMVWRPDSPSAENARNLWAPEVYAENGRFFLYFAAGGTDGEQRLWRAAGRSPLGPFQTDPGGPLTDPWRIDVTLFRDDDGATYAYGCHRLPSGRGARVEGCRIAGPGGWPAAGWQPMLAARAAWEGIWVEAPTVLKDRFGYYLLYSAPDAESPNYAIGYATAPHPLGPWQRRGILVPHVPGVPGPGHQGVVIAPDNLTPYLVYHRKRLAERGWDRDLMLDRLAMVGGRLETRAPTTTPQPPPPRPAFEDHFDSAASQRSWPVLAGRWGVDAAARELVQRDPVRPARAQLRALRFTDGVIEVNLRRLAGEGELGLALVSGSSRLPVLLFPHGSRTVVIGAGAGTALPADLDPAASHQLLLTRRGPAVELRLDGLPVGRAGFVPSPAGLELLTQRASAAFAGIAVTPYTELLPLGPAEPPAQVWHRSGDRIEQPALGSARQVYPLARPLPGSGTVSARIQGWALGTSLPVRKYGLQLDAADGSGRIEAYIDPANGVLATHGRAQGRELRWQNSDLPLGFDYTDLHVLTLRRRGARWQVTVDGGSGQERTAPLHGSVRPALVTEDARAAFSRIMVKPGTR